MQIKIFSIPIGGDNSIVEEMNLFLRANKVIDIKKDLAMLDGSSCWTFCITYLQDNRQSAATTPKQGSGTKVDYKEVLEPAVFERFAALRKIRKQIAESDAVPAFAVFTDAELAEMAKPEELTLQTLQAIPGIGEKKVEKYGNAFVASIKEKKDETGGTPDRKDSDA